MSGILDHGLILGLVIAEFLLLFYWLILIKGLSSVWAGIHRAMQGITQWETILAMRHQALLEVGKGRNGRIILEKALDDVDEVKTLDHTSYGQLLRILILDGWQQGWVGDQQAEEMVFGPADQLQTRVRNMGSLFIIVGVAGTLIGLASLVPRIFEVMASQNLQAAEVGGLKTILSYSLIPSILGVIFTFSTVFLLEWMKGRTEGPLRAEFQGHYFLVLKPRLVSQSRELDTLRSLAERNMEAVGESMAQAARVLDKVDEFEAVVSRTGAQVKALERQASSWAEKAQLQREVVERLAQLVDRDFASFPARFTTVMDTLQEQNGQMSRHADALKQSAQSMKDWMGQHQEGIQAQTRFVELARDSVQRMDQHFAQALDQNQAAMRDVDTGIREGFQAMTGMMQDHIMRSFSSIQQSIELESGKAVDRVRNGANSIDNGITFLSELGDRLNGLLEDQNNATTRLGRAIDALPSSLGGGSVSDDVKRLDKEMKQRMGTVQEALFQVDEELRAQRSWFRRMWLWLLSKLGRKK